MTPVPTPSLMDAEKVSGADSGNPFDGGTAAPPSAQLAICGRCEVNIRRQNAFDRGRRRSEIAVPALSMTEYNRTGT